MLKTLLLILFVASPVITFAQQTLTVSAVGDVMMGTTYPSASMLPSNSGMTLFKESRPYLASSDIRFVNFEGTFFEGGPQFDGKAAGPNRYLFQTPIAYADILKAASINVVSLANNHARDFGRAGLESTKTAMRSRGIQYSSKDGGEVATFNIRGIKVALIAADFYSGNRSVSTPQKIWQEIALLKSKFDVVIVSAHVGGEGAGAEHVYDQNEIYLGENRGNSVSFAHKAIDSGADLLVMHGPHVPRALEVYRNRLIAYSLGNFITGRGIGIGGLTGLAPLLQVELDRNGAFVGGKLISFYQSADRTRGAVYDSSKRVLMKVAELTASDFPYTGPQFQADGSFGQGRSRARSLIMP